MSSGKKIVFIFLIIALLAGSGGMLNNINEQREKHNLTFDMPLEDAPPELVLMTTVLGGFRGLIVNYLWVRAMELQQEGNYFELVQLFDWIGKLQPRFETVWVYAGWNMSYNISVKLTTPSERWAWVQRGIEILRDEGLRYNPGNPFMYRELAWIYLHKIGGALDDFHWDYKFYLADQMSRIIGPGNVFLPRIADIHNTDRSELLKNPDVEYLAGRIQEKGYDPFGRDFSEVVLGYREPSEELVELLEDESWNEPAGLLADFARMRELRKKFRLNPGRMLELREDFGPLDWRLAQSIALYWLSEGVEAAGGKQDMNHDRLILHCLISLTESGRLVMTEAGTPAMEPDFRFIEPTDRFYAYLVEKYEHDGGLASAHESFLQKMVVNLFTYGLRGDARETYARLRELKPRDYTVSMEDFVISRIMERVGDISSVSEVSSLIRGLIRQALYELSLGNDERASGMENLSKLVWQRHMKQHENAPQYHLPPFESLRSDVVVRALEGEFPEELLPYLRKRLRTE